ncbi:valine--tRNA ligase [Anoxynatronum buryatiense]|uniref:Valine--tRNA ligase n=1 Tax=Anoxynatronum buryatiense TaxID=489973 RepID=A0AA45WT97_9CLOT|nr:valine--tRNA ligase [Anoxynatronum buryatiense]SMP41260.1 valyl-tRNA synthetase [Anoxynatronum buryatiense]
MANQLPKNYDPKDFEKKVYQDWLEKGYFRAEVNENKTPFSIMLPPPNITGALHLGHALDQTIQDILIRYKRMSGFEALWMPGTDHASIATEVKVVEKVKEEKGISKQELGREKFMEEAWAWRDTYGRRIVEQMQQLGSSCDWERERFTMDEGCSAAVTEVFVRLFEKGLIYRGNRIINWCPDCKTSLSDAEVEHEDKMGNFWHVKYPIKGEDSFIEIATTRPETILGDTAVAVHPDDERYKHLIGKIAILPVLNREIPIIADTYVDPEFGTGAVKITPCHDPNDFEVGVRHDLPQIRVMNDDASINELGGPYVGMARYECRKALVKDLDELGLLVAVKERNHNVGHCYRCHTAVEPLTSEQWFVRMEPLAKPAIEAVRDGSIKFVPERFDKTYFHWLENIRDWCISRQLWWGHRIPAYYCDDCQEITVARQAPSACSKCNSTNLRQDEDALDTWFSSALWTFSTLGWPEQTPELKYFHPTDVLVTGYDIIFFWVVRMVFSSLEFMEEIPFKHVLIHGLVRDAQGRKMSKSLGNGVDPLQVIDEFGADALRYTLIQGNSPGSDMRFSQEKLEAARNFANKLWNATRFVLMNLEEEVPTMETLADSLALEDEWILSRLERTRQEVTANLDKFELGLALQKIYDFTWNEYCDWYIEMTKTRLYGDNVDARKTAQGVLTEVLKGILRLLHPFMPFITEEIWQTLPNTTSSVMVAPWPEAREEALKPQMETRMEHLMTAIRNIRNIRAEMNVPHSVKAALQVVAQTEESRSIITMGTPYLKSLAGIGEVSFLADETDVPNLAVSTIIPGAQLYIPLAELIDLDKEIQRLEKEKEKALSEIKRVEGKLANEGFMKKAPEKLVEEEKAKKAGFEEMLVTLEKRIAELKI